jgi:hypothetical protein
MYRACEKSCRVYREDAEVTLGVPARSPCRVTCPKMTSSRQRPAGICPLRSTSRIRTRILQRQRSSGVEVFSWRPLTVSLLAKLEEEVNFAYRRFQPELRRRMGQGLKLKAQLEDEGLYHYPHLHRLLFTPYNGKQEPRIVEGLFEGNFARPFSQMAYPPQLLQKLLRRPCSRMARLPHLLHWIHTRPCSQREPLRISGIGFICGLARAAAALALASAAVMLADGGAATALALASSAAVCSHMSTPPHFRHPSLLAIVRPFLL